MHETAFQDTVRVFYQYHGRHDLPWRRAESDGRYDPYTILVSEIMLQQTQVSRVISKYHEFLGRFPDVEALARAPFAQVLAKWSGLGYNRRAQFLWKAAQCIVAVHGGTVPADPQVLCSLPGVGRNTAGAIAAYAFNQPAVFIETNIRTVYLHHFFHNQQRVPDTAILAVVERTLERREPREWYWALMDYGSYLKRAVGSVNQASRTYARQSRFEGSKRQLRGRVIKTLLSGPSSRPALAVQLGDQRLDAVLDDMIRERPISEANGQLAVPS